MAYIFAPYYFPIWELKPHFYFLFNLQCISLLHVLTAILYLALEVWNHLFNQIETFMFAFQFQFSCKFDYFQLISRQYISFFISYKKNKKMIPSILQAVHTREQFFPNVTSNVDKEDTTTKSFWISNYISLWIYCQLSLWQLHGQK